MTDSWIKRLIELKKKVINSHNEHGYDSQHARFTLIFLLGYIESLEIHNKDKDWELEKARRSELVQV
jgi:hypothetical protein